MSMGQGFPTRVATLNYAVSDPQSNLYDKISIYGWNIENPINQHVQATHPSRIESELTRREVLFVVLKKEMYQELKERPTD